MGVLVPTDGWVWWLVGVEPGCGEEAGDSSSCGAWVAGVAYGTGAD